MEHDEREGLVQQYLEKLLPENWDSMNLYDRHNFLHGNEDFAGNTDKAEGILKRKKVCVMEVWCECFRNKREDLKRSDSYEIEAILNKIGCWKKLCTKSGKTRYPIYGPQRTFIRVN